VSKQKEKYIAFLKGTKTDFNFDDVLYIQWIIGNTGLSKDKLSKITKEDAESIIKQFNDKSLVQLTQKLSVGMVVNSDTLYAKINKAGKDIFIGENDYLRLKLSIKNGFNEFLLSKWSQEFEIYTFVSGYNSNQNYFDSLIINILSLNDETVLNLLSFDSNKDIKERGIIKTYLKYMSGEKKDSMNTQWSYLEILRNLL
jgi:hypothetical protein